MKTYLNQSEVRLLEEAATNLRDRLLVRLLSRSGYRISEVLALSPEDIDLKQGTVVIPHLKTRMRLSCPFCNAALAKAHSFCPKCGKQVKEAIAQAYEQKKVRTLPLDPDTVEMIKRYIELGGPIEKRGELLIFGIGRGQGWRIIKECAEKAGLGKLVNPESGKIHDVSPHRLRDAFAVHAVKHDDSGDALRMLQLHLGHASFDTTARYRKVSGQEHRDWYQQLWEKEDAGD